MEEIRQTYMVQAPRRVVYEKWVSNATVIPPAVRIEIVPEVGGIYLLVCRLGESELQMKGTFRKVVPYAHLEYTWEWNGDGKISLVQLDFREQGNATEVVLAHTGFADPTSAMIHASGWDSYMAAFSQLCEGGD